MYKQENKQLTGIQRYYTRTKQGAHANNYYIEPKQSCPIDVLNDKKRFVILTFDKKDDYIVIRTIALKVVTLRNKK